MGFLPLGSRLMANAIPLAELSAQLSNFVLQQKPPAWLVNELQDKLVILLNHVLSQEPAAVDRLRRQQGRRVGVSWRTYQLHWLVTPAGLLERSSADHTADLRIHVQEDSPLALVQGLSKGEKPAMRIEGDVMLAAEVNWLADHVRWDAEEDLSRLVGDAMAHHLVSNAKRVFQSLREFVRK
jgi:ubiquinone biosynthesis protein UbiJ